MIHPGIERPPSCVPCIPGTARPTRPTRSTRAVAFALAAAGTLALSGCSPARSAAEGESAGAVSAGAAGAAGAVGDTGSTSGGRAAIARLEREARALARRTGCTRARDCRTAPLGATACGSPRDYLVYCAASTDAARLMRTLRELARAERARNEASGMMSTCEMRLAPTTALVGGSCREGAAGGQ